MISSRIFRLALSTGTLLSVAAGIAAEAAEDLQLQLKTDKANYAPGDQIVFTETFKNTSQKTIQIIDDRCGYGNDVQLTKAGVKCEHATTGRLGHTLKPGLRPGKRTFLKAGESFNRSFKAYVTKDYAIAFQGHGSAGFTGFSAGADNVRKLPPEFFGCGAIYEAKGPGKIESTISYRVESEWSTGEALPPEPLWKGVATSPPVTFNLK